MTSSPRTRGRRPQDPVERFHELAAPEPNSGCWLWLGQVRPNGYGSFWNGAKWVAAHRASYEMFVAPIPDGLCVLHTCDTPLCVNPRHLWLGTRTHNAEDMTRKGRRARGVRNNHAKLTPERVRHIRQAATSAAVCRMLAKRYGVTVGAIHKARRGHTWGHVR